MSTHEFKPTSVKEMVDALQGARDRARVQAHLFSLDAKQRWRELERELLSLESKLQLGGQDIAEAAAAKFSKVSDMARTLLGEIDGQLELATPVRKVMADRPRACSPTDTLERAAQIMWEQDCGAVPVLEESGRLCGIITDRDVCMAAYTRGQPLSTVDVYSTMSKQVFLCGPQDSIGHALRLMANKQVRRLPVWDAGELVGLITLADIVRHISKFQGNSGPASLALASTLAAICERRVTSAAATEAAE